METSGQLATLNASIWSTSPTIDNVSLGAVNFATSDWWHPYVYPQTYVTYRAPEYKTVKVRLKMSEVVRLKKAADADPKLREVLVKLTPAIEVEIDL